MADLFEYEAKYKILQYTHTHTKKHTQTHTHTHNQRHEEVKILLDDWYLDSKTKFIKLESQDQPVTKIEWWQSITHKIIKKRPVDAMGAYGGIA